MVAATVGSPARVDDPALLDKTVRQKAERAHGVRRAPSLTIRGENSVVLVALAVTGGQAKAFFRWAAASWIASAAAGNTPPIWKKAWIWPS